MSKVKTKQSWAAPKRSCSATTGNLDPQLSAFLCGDRRNEQLGGTSSSQCKTIKAEARINRQSGSGHVILQIHVWRTKIRRCRYVMLKSENKMCWQDEGEFNSHW